MVKGSHPGIGHPYCRWVAIKPNPLAPRCKQRCLDSLSRPSPSMSLARLDAAVDQVLRGLQVASQRNNSRRGIGSGACTHGLSSCTSATRSRVWEKGWGSGEFLVLLHHRLLHQMHVQTPGLRVASFAGRPRFPHLTSPSLHPRPPQFASFSTADPLLHLAVLLHTTAVCISLRHPR